MAQSDFDPYELLDALRGGEDVDLIRRSVELVLRALIEAEATAVIGAAPHERTDGRLTYRNGHRPRMLATKAGDLELQIPKLRSGSFFPEILERRRRVDRALFAVVMEAYVHGVSDQEGRRPGGGPRGGIGNLGVRGLADLSGTRHRDGGLPGAPARPRRVPLSLL